MHELKVKSLDRNKSLEKQFSGDDLDYLASKGFEKAGINLNDVKQIERSINARTFASQFLNPVLVGGLVAIVFTGLFFVLTKNEEKNISSRHHCSRYGSCNDHPGCCS